MHDWKQGEKRASEKPVVLKSRDNAALTLALTAAKLALDDARSSRDQLRIDLAEAALNDLLDNRL